MPFRHLLLAAALVPSLTLAHAAAAQTAGVPAAATYLRSARALYYTPVDRGLESFRCDVSFDWKNFMQKASNQPVPADDARLRYLQSIQLSVEDSLRGAGELHWNAPTPPPDASADSVSRIREGIQQVWSGFFQSWNGFVTGDLVTLDSKAVAEVNASGFHVAVRTGGSLAEEQFDSALLLQSVHVITPSLDSTLRPTFTHDPQGLLLTALHSTYRQPPSAAPADIETDIQYAPVNGFPLPSAVKVDVGTVKFEFGLANCTVQTQVTPK